MENYYQVLGVAQNASAEEIRTRYRTLVKENHPDHFPDPIKKAKAEDEMKRLNAAYSVLSNSKRRAEYDATLRTTQQKPGRPAGSAAQETDFSRQANEILDYLRSIEERWKYLVDPFPKSRKLQEAKQDLLRSVLSLLIKTFPGEPDYRVNAFQKDLNSRIDTVLRRNICLGAAYEGYGYSRQFDRFNVLIVSTIEVQGLLHQLSQSLPNQRPFLKKELERMHEAASKKLFKLCYEAQAIGRAVVQAKRATSATGGFRPGRARAAAVNAHRGFCQVCGRFQPVKRVIFFQSIGLIVLWFRRKISGTLCAHCIEKSFWKMTSITLLLGWWGVISFFASPFIMLINLINYLGAMGLRQSAGELGRVSAGWKMLTFFILAAVAWYLLFANPAVWQAVPEPAVATNGASGAATPTEQPVCRSWKEVSSADQGKFLCVQGLITNTYWGDERTFYMSFNEDANALRLIIFGGYYVEGVQGKCVMGKGMVKTSGSTPYIVLAEPLARCP